MDPSVIAIVGGGFLAYSLVSGRLAGTPLTAPLAFVLFGLVIGSGVLGLVALPVQHGFVHVLAEVTLIIVLFSDAARIDLKRLIKDHGLPLRLLLIGMPLTVLLGTLAALQLLPQLALWEAALLAAILAPTDAALGQAVVSDKSVPLRIRQALNVESGLNDGIALPAVLIFASLASAGNVGESEVRGAAEWVQFGLLQVTLGPLTGILCGYLGGRAIDAAAEKRWIIEAFEGPAVIALALLAFVIAETIGGNGFIAAFAGGLVFGASVLHRCHFLFEFMEGEGQFVTLLTFLIFGATMVPEAWSDLDWRLLLFAALSLTLIRMIPAAFALLGTGLSLNSLLFIGWFGPRGLASILFALLILEEHLVDEGGVLLQATVVTVGLSVLLHGLTAAPLAKLYGRFVAKRGECAELIPIEPMRLRHGNEKKLRSESSRGA